MNRKLWWWFTQEGGERNQFKPCFFLEGKGDSVNRSGERVGITILMESLLRDRIAVMIA